MYWSACCGHGLALNEEEFQAFLDSYMAACRDEELLDILQSVKDDDIGIGDVMLKGADGTQFTVYGLGDDASGFMLVPYRKDGKVNAACEESGRRYGMGYDGIYVIEADLEIDGPGYFEDRKPYASYDSFIGEFKAKLAPYMPCGFDWDDHAGRYGYASPVED